MQQEELQVTFDINTIDHLGVKLYSTIPPMIAELVSNAWDADASNVYINFNNEGEKTITVSDDGTGMTFSELNDHFLKVGRNRRAEMHKDETEGGRKVLGKKGLGKLSMFGIGKKITISTVKAGLKNTFVMDYKQLKDCDGNVYKPAIIDYCVKTDEKNGTTFLIEQLSRKSDFDIDRLHRNLQTRFHIYSDKFIVHINNDEKYKINSNDIPEDKCQFVWKFPEDFEKDFDVEVTKFKELFEFGKAKGVHGKIYTAQTPLNKDVQGIVLFSRGKLVQEHSAFDDRANDNFFQYMSGSFDVDFIDSSFDIDNCSTDRKSLAWDIDENEELYKLQELLKKLVSITQKKWREQRKAEKKKKVSSHGHDIDEWIKTLNPTEKTLAQKLTNAIIENDDINEDTAADYIGCIKDMYSFEGFKQFTAELDELQELDNEHAIRLLTDWNNIEAKEYAKIAIGRIKTIEQFDKFIRTDASERDVIQKFLEEFPWLLDPKMSKFEREITYINLLKRKFADESELPESNRRLDFLCTNSSGTIHIIELKRPSIKLRTKEIQQISEYVEFIETQFPQTQGHVKGFLISDNMTYEPGAEKVRKGLESVDIYVKSYSDLLAEARRYNDDLYKMYENISKKKNEKDEE